MNSLFKTCFSNNPPHTSNHASCPACFFSKHFPKENIQFLEEKQQIHVQKEGLNILTMHKNNTGVKIRSQYKSQANTCN